MKEFINLQKLRVVPTVLLDEKVLSHMLESSSPSLGKILTVNLTWVFKFH